jgi:NAD(P)-dependent dehydrogenase (short-subunit alcohol dehydrogenase family)
MSSSKQFEGKVAIVTGAASGIGEATASAFADAGSSVVVADVQDDKGHMVMDRIKSRGGSAAFVKCDVRSETDIRNMVSETVRLFGRVDCAFNNAGVAGVFSLVTEQTNQAWDDVINTDLRGVWLCMKYEILQMLKQGGGAIVNCASICGLVGVARMSGYVAAKHGVVGLTKAVALEFAAQNIRVNAICPGAIRTPAADVGEFISDPEERERANAAFIAQAPISRWGQPEEIASAVLWMCSPGASLMLGHALAVDGGWTTR